MIGFLKKHSTLSYVLFGVFIVCITFTIVVLPQLRASHVENSVSIDPKSIDGQISTYKKAIDSNPNNITLYISLSQAYLQKIRETGDSSYYQIINEYLTVAEKIDPKNASIYSGRASVEIGRHHFKEGNQLAQKAIQLNPNDHLNYGLLGDSDIELGKYTEAVTAFQKMSDMRPDYAANVRIAYIRELYGDINGAKDALRLAISEGSSFKENIAFAYVELGKLDMRTDLNLATGDFQEALRTVVDYPPALEGLGKISYFKGDTKAAEDYFMQAYNRLPLVQYAIDMGDVAYSTQNTTNAERYYTLAQIAFKKTAESGVNTDLEESLFLSDHELDLANALKMAERAYVERPSVYAADYLAWAQYKNGNFKVASEYSKESLRLGENDPLILYHQGVIAIKKGDVSTGKRLLNKALSINPHFSILGSHEARLKLKNL